MSASFNRCRLCGDFDFLDRHKCKPAYEISRDNFDWSSPVYANSHEEAAEKWCLKDDVNSADYQIIRDGGLDELYVKLQGSDEVKMFKIHAESVPEYSAEEIPAPSPATDQAGKDIP